MTPPDVRILVVAAEGREALALRALRERVLRAPLGLRFSTADIAAEAADLHVAALAGDEVVGGVLLRPRDRGTGQLRQMAVAEGWRGRRLGAALVAALEKEAARRGVRRILLHARHHAEGFYARLGYAAEGDRFTEIGIPHRLMTKALPNPTAQRAPDDSMRIP